MNCPLSLTFADASHESQFRIRNSEQASRAVQMVAAVGAVSVAAFGFIDRAPGGASLAGMIVRYGVMVPSLLFAAIVLPRRSWRPMLEPLACVVLAIVLLGLGTLTYLSRGPATGIHLIGFLIVLLAGYVGLRSRWIPVTTASLVGSVAAVGAILASELPALEQRSLLLFVLVANVLGSATAWSHERSARVHFSDTRRIRNQSLELGRLNRRLRTQALSDSLTGLGNRRALEESFASLHQRDEDEESGAVLLLDLDGFKAINDQLGHATGDEVLRGVGRLISANLRATDSGFRFGGDEFCIVMPTSSATEAGKLGQRLARAVRDLGAPLGVLLGCSAGAAGIRRSDSDVFAALERADALLYFAKASGKGNVQVEGHPIKRPSSTSEVVSPALVS
jgi:diguanylate cyclase (GGDEF)-like protein